MQPSLSVSRAATWAFAFHGVAVVLPGTELLRSTPMHLCMALSVPLVSLATGPVIASAVPTSTKRVTRPSR